MGGLKKALIAGRGRLPPARGRSGPGAVRDEGGDDEQPDRRRSVIATIAPAKQCAGSHGNGGVASASARNYRVGGSGNSASSSRSTSARHKTPEVIATPSDCTPLSNRASQKLVLHGSHSGRTNVTQTVCRGAERQISNHQPMLAFPWLAKRHLLPRDQRITWMRFGTLGPSPSEPSRKDQGPLCCSWALGYEVEPQPPLLSGVPPSTRNAAITRIRNRGHLR